MQRNATGIQENIEKCCGNAGKYRRKKQVGGKRLEKESELGLEKELGKKQEKIAIYGAGMVAVSVYYSVKMLDPDCGILCFIVSDQEGNPAQIDGVPVLSFDEFCSFQGKGDIRIVVAMPENHHGAIMERLLERNMKGCVYIDSRKEAALMRRYYERIRRFLPLSSRPRNERKEGDASLHVYMAESDRDVPLKRPWKLPEWIRPVQAGAALTGISISDLKDNTGNHISEKNGNYSELTVLYWIWKNRENQGRAQDYIGLFHYRRILDLTEEDVRCAARNGIDAILPYPTVHFPSIDEHHKRYVKEDDWKAMVMALEELAPEYAKRMPQIFFEPYFYNYNMLVARKQVFHEFCAWLFPILKRTEDLSIPRGWERADRYIGYLGESLTTLYFMCHEQDLKIAHVGRILLT